MNAYRIQKIDTSLYVKGFSGELVYLALYSIVGTFILFVLLYILTGVFPAVAICFPSFFAVLYRLNRIQKKYGHKGWNKKRYAKKLPQFISVKRRICQT
ncbi:DUF4133 domain-containing protein [Labilibaculum sp.]|uniref:DUF4133 domain-containing protein n=1 Tax=Labilibaculum sp. TaxID=2060723 RepID=UPI003569D41F